MNRLYIAVVLLFTLLLLQGNHLFAQGVAGWVRDMRVEADAIMVLPEGRRAQRAQQAWNDLERRYPLHSDWLLQDGPSEPLALASPAGGRNHWREQSELIGDTLVSLLTEQDSSFWIAMIRKVFTELGPEADHLVNELRVLSRRARPPTEVELAQIYQDACWLRRERRLGPLLEQDWFGIVYARHFIMGGSHYAYTEGLSDAQGERHFIGGSALMLLRMEGAMPVVETLLEDSGGVIRDVDVSWDGTQVLFSWKKSDRQDDYSLYIMDMRSGDVQAITEGLGHADYEGVFLPNGDIIFNSTRCVQIVDCWWTEVSNLYTCDPEGRYLRRLSFDQVHTNYPTVTDDGRVLYTRWDYNDRGQLFTQGLFQMFPDGTGQLEYYGNNSWFPTTIIHARAIPGTGKTLAVFTGHHSFQAGKLGILDPSKGRQENYGAQLVAPRRDTPAQRIDHYGQEGDLFMYPYPIDDNHFLVSYAPRGWEGRGRGRYRTNFGLYFMDLEGRRELLDRDLDSRISTGRMVPLARRKRPHIRPSSVDYRKNTGVYYVQDVYRGVGLEGVERGAIHSLRVIGLDYRVAGIGHVNNSGPGGSAVVSTPVSIGGGTWDVKKVFGRAQVYADGSALFEAPARTPLYFQALDEHGQAVQSMRSWSTLQPGEFFSCIGCHDDKNAAPVAGGGVTEAMAAGVQVLKPFYGPAEGFSYNQRIQPILDRHCTDCHHASERNREAPFSLESVVRVDSRAGRRWNESYLQLTSGGWNRGPVRWLDVQSIPPVLPPYTSGAVVSPIMKMLREGHKDVQLSTLEMQTLACWIDLAVPFCGDYYEANAWNERDRAKYSRFMRKRLEMEEVEARNIAAFIRERQGVASGTP